MPIVTETVHVDEKSKKSASRKVIAILAIFNVQCKGSNIEDEENPKLDVIMEKRKLDFCDEPLEQPLYIDEPDEAIKCSWCPNWKGSQQTKVIDQHVKISASHLKARQKHLCLPDVATTTSGRQLDIRSFFDIYY